MSWFGAKDWSALGSELGLRPYTQTAGYAQGMGFRQLRRTFGAPATGEPSFSHRLYGRWKGVEVIVLTYDVGSGSSQTTYTGCLARIEPPLFLGLCLKAKPFLHGLFGGESLSLGDAQLDKELVVEGFDPVKVRDFFALGDPSTQVLLGAIRNAAPNGLMVTDSVADLSTQGTLTSAWTIAPKLDQVMWIARALSARRADISWTPAERAQRAEWQRFADTSGFAFDPSLMKLSGQVAGSSIEVALETEPGRVRTSVSVRFPTPVSFGFAVRRSDMPSFLQGLFSQDIRVGHPRFDALYIVTGAPEEAIRALLRRPPIPDILAELGAVSSEVQMHHEGLFFRIDGAFPTADQVGGLVERGRLASAALFGEVASLGPYR